MLYGDILSRIHDEGFYQFSRNAYREIADRCNLERIRVVTDLGCGSGELLKRFDKGNIRLFGVDQSEKMLSIARSKIPSAQLDLGSIYRYPIRPSDLITAIGEVLNYQADDPGDGRRQLQDVTGLFLNVHSALSSGGMFMFDVMLESETEDRTYQAVHDTDNWTVITISEEDKTRRQVTRRIVSFIKNGECYRKSTETHVLHLYSEQFLEKSLVAAGFQVETKDRYGDFALEEAEKRLFVSKNK